MSCSALEEGKLIMSYLETIKGNKMKFCDSNSKVGINPVAYGISRFAQLQLWDFQPTF